MNGKSFNISTVISKAGEYGRLIRPYMFIAFFVVTAALYGFVLLRIHSLSDMQPTDDAIATRVKAAQLSTIDNTVVKQLQDMQDNSVRVNTIFSDARNNPFH